MAVDTVERSGPAPTARRGAVVGGVMRLQRRSLLGWALALAIVGTIYTSFYPAMSDGADLAQMMEGLPEAYVNAFGLEDIASATGYLTSTVFGLLGPALLLVFGISTGARLLAGLEEEGTLELELTAPVARRVVYLERLAGLATSLVLLVAVLLAVVTLLVLALDMDVTATGVLAGGLGLLLFAFAHAALAFAVGAVTGRRGLGIAVAAGVAVLGYIGDAIGPMVDGLGWLQTVSPWYWYLGSDPLREGVDVGGFVLLLLVAVVVAVIGLVRFDRRDLMV